MTCDEKLALLKHLKSTYSFNEIPEEGGWFFQTYISEESIPEGGLHPRYGGGERSINSAIYFLLEDAPGCFSALHRLKTDETYHFYLGDPVEMLLLHPDGTSQVLVLGQELLHGQHVQLTVPQGTWQGSHLLPGGAFALMGCSMSPGFDPRDFALGKREELGGEYPDRISLIHQLTR